MLFVCSMKTLINQGCDRVHLVRFTRFKTGAIYFHPVHFLLDSIFFNNTDRWRHTALYESATAKQEHYTIIRLRMRYFKSVRDTKCINRKREREPLRNSSSLCISYDASETQRSKANGCFSPWSVGYHVQCPLPLAALGRKITPHSFSLGVSDTARRE